MHGRATKKNEAVYVYSQSWLSPKIHYEKERIKWLLSLVSPSTYLQSGESAQVGAVFDADIGSTTAGGAVRVLGSFSDRWRHPYPLVSPVIFTKVVPSSCRAGEIRFFLGLSSQLNAASLSPAGASRFNVFQTRKKRQPSQYINFATTFLPPRRFVFGLFLVHFLVLFFFFGVSEPTSALLVVRDPSSFVWRAGSSMASSKWRSRAGALDPRPPPGTRNDDSSSWLFLVLVVRRGEPPADDHHR